MGMGYYTCCYGDLLGQTRLGVGAKGLLGLRSKLQSIHEASGEAKESGA